MAKWYYTRGGEKNGPVDSRDIKLLVVSGQLLPTDLIWKEGMKSWVPAGSSPVLFPPQSADGVPSAAPPPLPDRNEPPAESSPKVPMRSSIDGRWIDLLRDQLASAIPGKLQRIAAIVSVLVVILYLFTGTFRSSSPSAFSVGSVSQGSSQWDNFVARVKARLQEDARSKSGRQNSGLLKRRSWEITKSSQLSANTATLSALQQETIGQFTTDATFDLDYSLENGRWRVVSGVRRQFNHGNGYRESKAIDPAGLYANDYLAGLFGDR
jgi:hypothetical protein